MDQAIEAAERIGYPVIVRPSYVLGGHAMGIVHNERGLVEFIAAAALVSGRHPVLIDRYVDGREVEVDAVCDGETVVIPGIVEHIERAGVHWATVTAYTRPLTCAPTRRGRSRR
ncbi:MAG: hypothetical protein WKH64_10790 [Chloroflexia bacterium]